MLELVHVATTYASPVSPERVAVLEAVSFNLRPAQAVAIEDGAR